MGRNIAFVHAGMTVRNLHERTPLLNELVGTGPLFDVLLRNLMRCKKLDSIIIVTSDRECDSSFCEVLRSSSLFGEERPTIEVLRIPSDSPHAFREENKTVDRLMLFRVPLYGLFSAEGFLNFTQDFDVDCGIVMNADSSAFVPPEFLNALIEKGSANGEIVALHNPDACIVAANPGVVKDLMRRKLSQVNNRLANRRVLIQKEIEYLKQNAHGLDNAALDELARRKLSVWEKQPLLSLRSLFVMRNLEDGNEGNIHELDGNEMGLLPITKRRDLERLRTIFSERAGSSLDDLYENHHTLVDEIQEVWPGYLNIELTSRSNIECPFLPGQFLKREHGMMEAGLYHRIVDQAAENVPFINLAGYGEPTLHPDLIDFVRYAKEKGVLRVAVETNAIDLDEKATEGLFNAGLDFLIVNMNALMHSCSDWEEMVDSIIRLRDREQKHRHGIFPKVMLQIVNTNSMASRVDYICARYNYIADRVVIVPFDTFRGTIPDEGAVDFTPLNRSACRKLLSTLFVLWDGTAALCGKFVAGEFPGMSLGERTIPSIYRNSKVMNFNRRHSVGSYPEECLECRQWYLLDFPGETRITWQSLISSEFSARRDGLTRSILDGGMELCDGGQYGAAIEKWEAILRHDPANEFITRRLSEIAGDKAPPARTDSETGVHEVMKS